MKTLCRWLYESSLLDGFWAAWTVGFCIVGADGRVYLTRRGEDYLAEKDAA